MKYLFLTMMVLNCRRLSADPAPPATAWDVLNLGGVNSELECLPYLFYVSFIKVLKEHYLAIEGSTTCVKLK